MGYSINLRREPRGIKRKERRIGFFDNLHKEIYIYIRMGGTCGWRLFFEYRGMTYNLEGGGNNLGGMISFILWTVQRQGRKGMRQC